ncbi:lipoprotein [Campylobacter sp.]|uniref:lipoprotein n=1 Tax=Campylobacter sp. TaxID=205 RepID=UPI0034C6953F
MFGTHQAEKIFAVKSIHQGTKMRIFTDHIRDYGIHILNLSHRGILAFFCLISLSACGYKGDPTYTSFEQNGSKTIKTYKILNRW